MEQPGGGAKIDQEKPVGEYEELAKQDGPERYIDGIARKRKEACCNEFVGVVCVDANAKTSPEGYQAEQEQQQPHYAEEYADPGEGLGVEELLLTHRGQTERGGKHDVEVEESKWGDEEVLLVDLAEMHRPDPASSHQQDAGDNHSEQQHDGN